MALIASCWLIVESFIIPNGFIKWFYLSFYIHPFFLVFSQLFLWLKLLFHPLKVVYRLILFVFGLIVRVVSFSFSYIRPTRVDIFYDALEPDLEPISLENTQIFVRKSIVDRVRFELVVVEMGKVGKSEEMFQDNCVEDSWLNQYLCSDYYYYYCYNSCEVQLEKQECTSSSCVEESSHIDQDEDCDSQMLENILLDEESDLLISSLDFNDSNLSVGDGEDPFQNKYTSRVRFYNVLFHERLHGINAILNEHSSIPSFSNCNEPSINYPMAWSKMARKRVLRSLECDLEMINVAQSCLLWEALDHQYHKVESLSLFDHCGNILFHHDILGKFQELEILLERFVETQICEGQKSSNVTSKRLSFQGLLQVPNATGFVVVEEENKMMMSEDYCIRPTQLLEAIDNCIKAFWLYIKTDDQKKSFWKNNDIWRNHQPVEDPQDLELLYNVVKDLHKKGIMLRGVQGKRKCWMRRKVKPMQEENEKRNLMGAMIDVKLVQRLLKMSLISKSHLKWCQEKLINIELRQETVFRGNNTLLFPSP